MEHKPKINDIIILYYLMKKLSVKPLINSKSEYVFRRYDIETDDENLAVCCGCLKRLQIRTSSELETLFNNYNDEINKVINNYKFKNLKIDYFKNVARYKNNSERFYKSFNPNNHTENYKNYVYYKVIPKIELNNDKILMNIVKDLNKDEIILNITSKLNITKNSYRCNNCIYTYYMFQYQIIESTHNISLLYLPLLEYLKNNKFIKFDENELIGIYLHQLHKIIILQTNKLNSIYKIWKQPNADIIRLYDKNNEYIWIKYIPINKKLCLYDHITYYGEK
jgi:hypothetical protein